MPVVLANLKPATLAQIQRLVEMGHYASPAEFMELAAVNQLQLEGDRGAQDGSPPTLPSPPPRKRERPAAAPLPTRRADPRRRGGVDEADVLQALGRLLLQPEIAPPSELTFEPPAAPGTENRIWGQVNRLLPIKFAVRWLAARGVADKEWSSIEDILQPVAADAATLGSVLEQADAEADRNRDELLATGLPRVGNNASADRFLSQYIARVTRTAIHPGAVVQYGLASLVGGRIALTRVGFEFALIRNPVIDGDLAQATTTLNSEEREFFVRRAVPFFPTELSDFSLILSFVADGRDTPAEQLELLGTQLPGDWSAIQVRTHVTGVVARMVDLGLLRRQWQGRHVRYDTTQLASLISEANPTAQGDPR